MKLNTIARETSHGEPHEEQPHPVIFLHGLFGRARNLGFLQRAASTQFKTFAFDLRCHGDSPHAPVTYPAMVQDVLETMDAIGLEKAALVGHSMGGKVSMLTALSAPERVSRLLVADMAPTHTHQGHGTMIAALRKITFPARLDRQQAIDLLLPHTGTRPVAELLLQNIRLGDNPGWSIGMEDIAEAIQIIEGWPDIHGAPQGMPWPGPALFLRGGNSTYVQPEHYAEIRALFPHAEIETLENAGHWLHAEQPQAFTEKMMAFLQT